MPMLELPSATLAWDARGDGPAVVLLPSGAHARSDYDALRDLLPGSVRTIALDWPAHGDSPPAPGPASAMSFADVAEQAVVRLAPEGAVVVGNSIGGFAAARLALRRPDLVRGLVLIDSGGFLARGPQVRAFCALMGRPRFLRRIYPAFSARYMRSRADADRAARERAIATTRDPAGLAAVAGLWASFSSPEHDLRAQAGAIAAPTLVLWGRRDPVIPVKVGRWLADAIPRAQLAELDTGHVPYTSDPEAVAAQLVPFLDAVLAAEAGAA
ncbi:MAG TPA: alpha/beta hydrolase [Conexibacter sp.]|jgi:pimeloyl-ACP methyl ester carboxylesterase|nr:alpha/beta hydrolase [Conexibacter sp.]